MRQLRGMASSRFRPAQRGGTVLVVVLVCLLVTSLLVLGLVRLAILRVRQTRMHEYQTQADLLTAAGLQRATARLQQDPAYTGETWHVDLSESPAEACAARVEITVATEHNGTPQREIVVVSRFPEESITFASSRSSMTAPSVPRGAEK